MSSGQPLGRLTMVGQDPSRLSLDAVQIRPRTAADTEAIGRLLNLVFTTWPTHHDWTPATVEDIAGSDGDGDVSVVIELPGRGLVGASLARTRPAVFNDQDVTLAYISVLGIHPMLRRRGLFGRLLAETVARARAHHVDVLGLQTVARHLSATVFARAGFRCVQPYHVVGAPLIPGPSHAPSSGRPIPLSEVPPLQAHRDVLRDTQHHQNHHLRAAHAWQDDHGGVAVIIWPVKVRGPEGWTTQHSCEVVRTWGRPKESATCARHVALMHGCVGMYQAPGTGPIFPGLFADDVPEEAQRLLLGVTPLGCDIAAQAIAWQPGFPSP